MSGPGHRPDAIGTAFGAFLLLAVLAVAVKVLSGPGADVAVAPLEPLVPLGERVAIEADEADEEFFSLGGQGLAHPLPPLYHDGPRELVPPAPHEPAEVHLPTLGTRSALLRLDKRPDGRMQVPGDFSLAGWYVRGPAPGQVGPAVIAGHLDSRRGPAVFAELGKLSPGDEVRVRRGDGHVVRFVVRRVASYPKDAFPTEEVYGETDGPELRLITCDGTFDRARRSYEENLVVYAVADPASLPPDPGVPTPADTPSPPAADPAPREPSPDASASDAPPASAPPSASPPPSAEPPPPSPGPRPRPSPTPSPGPTGTLPTEEPSPTPRPSGGVPLP